MIDFSKYENKVPYSIEGEATIAERRAQRLRHRDEGLRLDLLLKADLEALHGISEHPRRDRLWELAWEYGHSSGYEEVTNYYEELVDLLK